MAKSIHGKVVGTEPCDACGSRDNVKRYEDGYAKCFGMKCDWYEMPDGAGGHGVVQPSGIDMGPPLLPFEYEALPKWGISEDTCRAWGYGVGEDELGRYHVANEFDAHGRIVSQKVRRAGKNFRRTGNREDLGALLFGARARDSHRRIILTEGEKDTLATAQAFDLKWPVASVPNGATSALGELQEYVEWLDTFEEIVLLFDNDEAGQSAAVEVAEQLAVTPGKVLIGRVAGYKDAAEALIDGNPRAILEGVWNAKLHTPGGVVQLADIWDLVTEEPPMGEPYPWAELSLFLHGMRKQELVTWCAGSGVGKSAFVKEVAYQLAAGGAKVGCVFLEEGLRRTALDLLSLDLDRRLADPEIFAAVEKEELRMAFERLSDKILLYDHFGSMDDGALLAKLRWMAAAGKCEWIVLDHVSIVVSGQATEGDERKRIDKLMTDLRSFVQKSGVGLHLVSHLRRQGKNPHEEGGRVHLGDLRGSQAIAQLSDIVIGVERDQQHDDEFERNVSTLRVLKNRAYGDTGAADELYYDKATGRLTPAREARAVRHFKPENNDESAAL